MISESTNKAFKLNAASLSERYWNVPASRTWRTSTYTAMTVIMTESGAGTLLCQPLPFFLSSSLPTLLPARSCVHDIHGLSYLVIFRMNPITGNLCRSEGGGWEEKEFTLCCLAELWMNIFLGWMKVTTSLAVDLLPCRVLVIVPTLGSFSSDHFLETDRF